MIPRIQQQQQQQQKQRSRSNNSMAATTSFSTIALLLFLGLLHSATAVWYAEICHTGPRYKVRVDEATGLVVPVYDPPPFSESDKHAMDHGGMTSGGVFFDNSNPFSGNFNRGDKDDDTPSDSNNNNNSSDSSDSINSRFRDDDSARTDDDPIGNEATDDPSFIYDYEIEATAEPTQWLTADSSNWNNPFEDDENSGNDNDNRNKNRDRNSNRNSNNPNEDESMVASLGGAARRLLRSTRLWRDFDEDSESDALVINANRPDPSLASRLAEFVGFGGYGEDQYHRSLHHKTTKYPDDDLKEGEFYVKPCLCSGSRWTFRENAGLPQTVYNDTTDTLTQSGYYGEDIHPRFVTPQNYGRHSSGQYLFVPNNVENGDLFLCNVQSMYCGIPVEDDPSNNNPGSMDDPLAFLNRSGGKDQQKRRRVFEVRGLDGGPPTVKCYSQNMRHIIARNAWPLILLWYFGLAIICCCTVHGRTAGDYVLDQVTRFGKTVFCCCCRDDDRVRSYDFNDTMLHRMIDDDERERRRRNRNRNNGNNNQDDDDDDAAQARPWWFSHQRLQFERSLLAQVQWIWRHQEYLRELALREQGLPPPQLRLRVKKFTSVGRDDNVHGTVLPTSVGGGGKDDIEDDAKLPAVVDDTNTKPPASASKKKKKKKHSGRISLPFARRASNETTSSSTAAVEEAAVPPPADATVVTATDTTTTDTNSSKTSSEDGSDQDDTSSSLQEGDDVKIKAAASSTIEEDDKKCPPSDNEEQHDIHDYEEELEFVAIDLGPDAEDGDDPKPDPEGMTASAVATALACIPCEDSDNDDIDSLDLPTCAICFMPFEEGDRIADLACKHEFHVDCLKVWVQRKNSCPLCNVRLGRPERPMPAPEAASTNPLNGETTNNNTGGVERGLLRRIGRGLRRGNNSNSNRNSTGYADSQQRTIGAGEIQVGMRIGIIGVMSAAEDINATHNSRRPAANRS